MTLRRRIGWSLLTLVVLACLSDLGALLTPDCPEGSYRSSRGFCVAD